MTNRKFVSHDRSGIWPRGSTVGSMFRFNVRKGDAIDRPILAMYITRVLANAHYVEHQCFVIVEPARTTAKRNNETANGRVLRENFPFLCCHPRFLFLVYPLCTLSRADCSCQLVTWECCLIKCSKEFEHTWSTKIKESRVLLFLLDDSYISSLFYWTTYVYVSGNLIYIKFLCDLPIFRDWDYLAIIFEKSRKCWLFRD